MDDERCKCCGAERSHLNQLGCDCLAKMNCMMNTLKDMQEYSECKRLARVAVVAAACKVLSNNKEEACEN
jgi:hypothetical protein